MVTGDEGMSSACKEFTQNAWRKDLCANCQRSRGEHSSSSHTDDSPSPQTGTKEETDSPKPAKRNSLMGKSWTAQQPEGNTRELQNEDAKWDSMVRPDIEHNYEDIDEHDHSEQHRSMIDSIVDVLKENDMSRSKEEKDIVTVTQPRSSKSRSRSSSRDRSPLPAPKPKVIPNKSSQTVNSNSTKLNKSDTQTNSKMNHLKSNSILTSSPKANLVSSSAIHSSKASVENKDKLKAFKVDFVTSDPAVIAEDGGYDNLFLDDEEHLTETDDEIKEILVFTEKEKEWALLALKNTIWNSNVDNLKDDGAKLRTTQSKEFEDIELESLWKPDRFANVKDCVAFPEQTMYGTYPLRSKSGKSAIDSLFDGSSLETIDETYETFLKYGFGDSKEAEIGAKLDRLIANEVDISDANYDDPWGDKFGFDTESDMNLLDEIKGEIDLDSSSAGMALVDLLNDVLSKYSTGTPSETDSVKNMDNFYEDDLDKKEKPKKKHKKESKEIPTELEAKVVTLAASLRLKQRAKRHAPRPPICPPAPPMGHQVHPKSPAEQLEVREAQSKEPLFKMVPVGKPIGNSPVAQAQSTPTPKKIENENSQENMEGYKLKDDKDKPKKGGITGFFRNFLRRSKGSDSDLATSTDTVVTNVSQSSLQSESKSKTDKESSPSKTSEKPSKSSPQMKLKAMPGRPVSPKPPPDKPPDRPTQNVQKNTVEEPKLPDPTKTLDTKEASLDKNKDNKTEKEISPSSNIKTSPVDKESKSKSPTSSLNSSTKSTSSGEKEQLSPSSKSKEAPPLPAMGPRQLSDGSLQPPKPRMRGNSDGGPGRSRPRTRDMSDTGKPRDTPNVPPPKPPVAAKPKPVIQSQSVDTIDKNDAKPPLSKGLTTSPPRKERVSSTSSLDDDMLQSKGVRDPNTKTDPGMLRKRAKSPKRFHAPSAPRSSLPNVLSDSTGSVSSISSQPGEPKPLAFAKELELKLQKETSNITEVKKMSAPPPPSPTSKVVQEQQNSPKSVQKSSKEDVKESPKSKRDTETVRLEESSVATTTTSEIEEEVKKDDNSESTQIHPIEKIELPKPASSSRKSFLGKLNRKNKPPPPPSVKRTKSITESSIQGDQLHLKKIHVDLKDISGPVLITEMSSNKVVNRRNTISLGDDNAFLSGGSTSSGSTSTTGEKSEISPQGSLENMYELITPEAPPPPVTDKRNLYDPVTDKPITLRPPSINSLGIEGYLEPVRSNGGANVNSCEPVKPNTAESSDETVSVTTDMAASSTEMTPENKSDILDQGGSETGEIRDTDNLETLDISEARRHLLAAQPIYEEINGYGKLGVADVTDSRPILNGDPQLCQTLENSTLTVDSVHTRTSPSLQSKDSFSSESDLSSAGNSLSRGPRPIPRRRPRQSVGIGFEQYVAMNRPSVAVFLNEDQLREILSKLTAMNLQTLRELYTQHEKTFTKENVHLGGAGPLKWIDFDIYGKPVHTSERCVIYNAKLKQGQSPCQIMLLHSRPEMTTANHPSLLKPTCIFTDSIPYSYLTEEFIKTSQLLQTSVNQSNSAKCYIVVGLFDITVSVVQHLSSLESMCENQKEFLRKILFYTLQLLSAINHCLEQGHPLAEADFRDIYLISNPYCLGETVSFLPQLRSPENQQIDTVCYFIEKFLDDMCIRCEATTVLDDDAYTYFAGIQKIISMLQSGAVECLPVVRSYTEFLLWGPQESDLQFGDDRLSSLEPKLSMWLEKQRASLIHDFAKRTQNGARCSIEDFYNMKFLLKASSGSLAECIRCHAAS